MEKTKNLGPDEDNINAEKYRNYLNLKGDLGENIDDEMLEKIFDKEFEDKD